MQGGHEGKVAVVIGGAKKIGRGIVERFDRLDVNVVSVFLGCKVAARQMIELAEHWIRVNCYQPGYIETPLQDNLAFRSTVPWGRFGRPDDVAAACPFLATGDPGECYHETWFER